MLLIDSQRVIVAFCSSRLQAAYRYQGKVPEDWGNRRLPMRAALESKLQKASSSGLGASFASGMSVSTPGSGTVITFISPTTTPSEPGGLDQKANVGVRIGPSIATVAGVAGGILLLVIRAF